MPTSNSIPDAAVPEAFTQALKLYWQHEPTYQGEVIPEPYNHFCAADDVVNQLEFDQLVAILTQLEASDGFTPDWVEVEFNDSPGSSVTWGLRGLVKHCLIGWLYIQPGVDGEDFRRCDLAELLAL